MLYIWRKICRNSLEIVCIWDNKTVVKYLVFKVVSHFKILALQIFNLRKVGKGRVKFALCCRPMASIRIYKSSPMFFCAISNRFRYINVWILYLRKLGQGQRVKFSQWCHSMANIKINKHNFFYSFIFAKVRSMRTKVTHTQTDTIIDKTQFIGLVCNSTGRPKILSASLITPPYQNLPDGPMLVR